MQSPLNKSVIIHNEMKRRIMATYSLDEDDPFLIDSLDGESDLKELICKILLAAQETSALADGTDAYCDKIQARSSRLHERAKSFREAAKWAMQEAGIPKIEAPAFTASLRAGTQGVVITNEDDLPDKFVKIETKRKPDKNAIKEALKAGESLSCAYLSNPETVLTVRVR